jgi:DnaJ family protein B protein 12
MDGNKDESERCIQIAERRIRDGDFEQAIKFLRKADKLYPSIAAQSMS